MSDLIADIMIAYAEEYAHYADDRYFTPAPDTTLIRQKIKSETVQRCIDAVKKERIQGKAWSNFEDGYGAAIEVVIKALEAQK